MEFQFNYGGTKGNDHNHLLKNKKFDSLASAIHAFADNKENIEKEYNDLKINNPEYLDLTYELFFIDSEGEWDTPDKCDQWCVLLN